MLSSVRILALTQLYPTPLQQGLASFNRQQFAELSRLHELRVIRPIPWPVAALQWIRGQSIAAVPVTPGSVAAQYPTYYYMPRVRSDLFGPCLESSVRKSVERMIESYRPDVLLTSWAHPDGWATMRFGRRAGLPVVLKVLGSDVLVLAKGRRRQPIVDALCGVDSVIAVSEDLARQTVSLGASPSRVHVVPEGLDTEIFSPGDQSVARLRLGLPASGRIILFVGNLLRSKGVVDLVHACALLRDRGVQFGCRIVGQGPDAAILERAIRTSHLADHVSCVGGRPHAELADWFRASDVVTLPSYTEGIPNVLREAISCGKPFVSTSVGGIPEISHPSFSRLVPPGSIAELADALAHILEDVPQIDRNIVQRINISWAESARLLAGHLKAAVDGRSRP